MAKGGRRAHAGRKPKPTDLKVVQGTFRGDRHAGELRVPLKWPEPPAHLNDGERALWGELETRCAAWVAPSDWLAINGVVSLMDRLIAIQSAMRATEQAGSPITMKFTPSADGEPNMEAKDNPLFGLELKYWTALRGFLGIVGLSPVDRARVNASGDDEKPASKLDRFTKKVRA